jgi:methylated-DNA-[protein]-cysteine S-methyltransferase
MAFNEKVYEKLRNVPKGKVTTYKSLAESLNTKAYQAVGNAMKNNPHAPEVPCHRVVKSDGSIGGFKGKKTGKAIEEKINMLKKEGIKFENKKIKNFKEVLYRY